MRRILSLVGLCASASLLVSGCVVRKLIYQQTPPTGGETVPRSAPTPRQGTPGKHVSISTSNTNDTSSVVIVDSIENSGENTSVVIHNGSVSINGKTILPNRSHVSVHHSNTNGGQTRTVSQSVPSASVRTVAVRTDYGAITVEPSADATHIGVTAVVTLGDNNCSKAEQEKYLRGFTIPSVSDSNTYTARVEPPAGLPKEITWIVSYQVSVPPSVTLDLKTENGAVAVRDTQTKGTVRARSDYGAITVINAGNTVDAQTQNGAVSIAGSTSRDSVHVRSDYGAISVTGPAKTIDAKTENGAIQISDAVSAQVVTAQSSYGAISLQEVGGAVDAQTENGAVYYSGTPTKLALKSEYGDIAAELAGCGALTSATLSTQNGSVKVSLPESASVSFTGHTDNGSINVHSFTAQITGDAYDKSFTAKRNGGRTPISLSTSYGSLTVTAR